jgi:RsiW-degrading membrane proteinase PrsW (M82 family)
MAGFKQSLITLSRDRNFLLRGALLIGALGILSGFLVSKLRNHTPQPDDLITAIRASCPWLTDDIHNIPLNKGDIGKLLQLVSISASRKYTPENLAKATRAGLYPLAMQLGIPQNILSPKALNLFSNYSSALHKTDGKNRHESRTVLKSIAESAQALRFANEFHADILSRDKELAQALLYFEREVTSFPQSDYAKAGIMRMLLALKRTDSLALRFDDPGYRNALNDQQFTDITLFLGKWMTLISWHGLRIIKNNSAPWLLVTAFAATLWLIIIANLGKLGEAWRLRGLLYILGFAGGFLSTFAVLGILTWQEHVLGFNFNGDFANDLIYCICGIGLREESVKLLVLVPFLPVLRKRKSPMEALATAACVGLGFAAAENLIYINPGSEGGVFPRFLTANFFHASLTGIAGLALFHFVRWPRTRWEGCLATFIVVIFVHGLYDAAAGLVPQISGQLGIFTIIIFALVANRYINLAKELREGGSSSVSPLGVFVIGTALLVAAAWNLGCYLHPIQVVMRDVGQTALAMGAMSFLFINQFRGE